MGKRRSRKGDVLEMRALGSAEPAVTAEQEVAKLQGAWRQLTQEADGIKNHPDAGDVGGITTFSGNNFTVRNLDGSVVLRGSFSIDTSVSPKAIDWIDSTGPDAGKILPASYELNGDSFVFIAGAEGSRRPTEFATKIGETMRSFVRER